MVKNLPAQWETQVQSLGQKDPLEKELATHSNCSKVLKRTTIWSSSSVSGYLSEENKNIYRKGVSLPLSIYIHTQWNIINITHIKEMLPVATWLELNGIMLSEISQTEKGDYHMISLICGIYKTNKQKPLKYREQIGGCQRWRVKSEQNGWRGQKIQTSSYKINRSWDIMCRIVTMVNNTV